MSEGLVIRGERYVTATRVAELYSVRVEWVREVCDYGLLEPLEHVGDEPAIAARLLDRVAVIQRLSVVQGVNLPGIAIILDLMERAP
ncbi:MAG TPA: chaperone modulator CbpM [Planctomycetota bacterium]|nr:chaperone modulator CbpM [Planctomycetota bacterium]